MFSLIAKFIDLFSSSNQAVADMAHGLMESAGGRDPVEAAELRAAAMNVLSLVR